MITGQSIPENHPESIADDRKAWHAIFDIVCALVIGLFAAYSIPNSPVETSSRAQDSYYNQLVQSFRSGQLNLKSDAAAELGKVTNPYAAQNLTGSSQRNRELTDLSYYKGKLYLYYGVTPVLVVLWPFASLTGHYLSDRWAVLIFFSLGFWIAATLLRDIRRRYFPEANIWLVVAAIFASGLAIAVTLWCNTNEVAITCGFAFTMLALAAIWRAMHAPKHGAGWLQLASLAYGLAVGARPSLVFGVIILLIPVIGASYRAHSEGSYRQVVLFFLAAVIPAMLVGAGLMFYNILRFDSPFEFGWHYQLNELYGPSTARQFSLHYFWFNFRDYFLVPMGWSADFPFLRTVPLPPVPPGYNNQVQVAMGAVPETYPLVLLALAAPLAWKNRPADAAVILRLFAAALFLLFIICFSTMCLFFTAGARYELDFLPALLLLACLGLFGLERAGAGWAARRRIARWGLCFVLAYSVVFNLLAGVETHAEIHYLAGNSFLSVGKMDEATAQYQKALALWPGSPDAHFGAGNAFFQKGQMDEAIAEYKKAVDLNPNFPEARNNLAYSFLRTGRIDDAIIQYQKTLELTPDTVAALNNLAFCYLQAGQVDNAIVQYRKAVELQPDSAVYHCALGDALLQKGQIDGAMTEFQKALKIKPDFAAAHNFLGSCFFRTGRTDEAIVEYQRAIGLKPDFAPFYNNLGDAFHRKGMEPEAAEAYKKASGLQGRK
jgi:Flp pilus assembly protein TadD